MVIYGDYHTHTFYSDGKQSVMQSAVVAKQKGLKEIAITDHGFNKKNGIKRQQLEKLRQECKQAEEQTGVKVLLGIEANLISRYGDIDVNTNELDKFDILIVGFHQIVKAKSLMDKLKFVLPNNLGLKTKKVKNMNTVAMLKAMEKYPIDIISHPGVGFYMDITKVGEKAKQKGIKMELNGKRIAYKQSDIKELVENQVEFVLSSDAHSEKRIGECDKGINFALKNQIPKHLISNLGKKPNFNSFKESK